MDYSINRLYIISFGTITKLSKSMEIGEGEGGGSPEVQIREYLSR